MSDDDRSSSEGRRNDWLLKLAGGVGGVAGSALALFVIKPLVELPFWPALIAFVGVTAVGIVLGRLVGGLLFWPTQRDRQAQTSQAEPKEGDQQSQ